MGVRRRDFLLLATLAAATASVTAVFGQAVTPTVGQPAAVRKAPHPSRISPAYGVTPIGPASNRRHPALVR